MTPRIFGFGGPSAGPFPSRPALAMCMRLDAACIAVPQGDRLDTPAFSEAGAVEGHHHYLTIVIERGSSARSGSTRISSR